MVGVASITLNPIGASLFALSWLMLSLALQVPPRVTHAFWWAWLQTRGNLHHFHAASPRHSYKLYTTIVWLNLLYYFLSQLLVQFVQNASIPLVQGLEDSDSKHSCLPLLAPAESSLCSPLELTGQQLQPHHSTLHPRSCPALPCPTHAKNQ